MVRRTLQAIDSYLAERTFLLSLFRGVNFPSIENKSNAKEGDVVVRVTNTKL